MYTKLETIAYHVDTDGAGSGSKIFSYSDCTFCDLKELHRMCADDSKEVIICLHPTNSDKAMVRERFYLTGEAVPTGADVANKDTYVFSCYSRSMAGVVNRKMIMTFNDSTEMLTVTYQTS